MTETTTGDHALPCADRKAANEQHTSTLPPMVASPLFLESLLNIRRSDAVSGGHWREAPMLTTQHAFMLGHIDRANEAMCSALKLLQASETCRRRQPEDFGIGEDLHEGLLLAVRELAEWQRDRISQIERGRRKG